MINFTAKDVGKLSAQPKRCKTWSSPFFNGFREISRFPKILAVQFKRFKFGGFSGNKITSQVKIPELLDLTKFVTSS